MTDGAVRRALHSAIYSAFHIARRGGSEQLAIDYADSLVLPIVEQRVEEAIEDGYAQAKAGIERRIKGA